MMVCRGTQRDRGGYGQWLTYDSSYWRLRYARTMRLRLGAFVEMRSLPSTKDPTVRWQRSARSSYPLSAPLPSLALADARRT
jgi:hypothetical protein